jgi:hypothetical protein
VIGSVAVSWFRWERLSHGRHSIKPTTPAANIPNVVIHGVFLENKETTPMSEANGKAASYRNEDPSTAALFGLQPSVSIREPQISFGG